MNIDKDMAELCGWHLVEETHDYCFRAGRIVPHHAKWWKNNKGNIEHLESDWHPSVNINQALGNGKSHNTVVGAMREHRFGLYSLSQLEDGRYCCCFLMLSDDERFYGTADTPAGAICEAAKKAMEG